MSVKFIRFFHRHSAPGRPRAGISSTPRHLPVPFDGPRPIAFMHIPKTSGTAVISGLMTALASPTVVGGFDRSLFGSFQDFDSLQGSARCQIYDSPASLRKDAALVAGHFAFSTLRDAYPLAQRFTILREPMSRLLSHWLFWRQHIDEDLAPWGNWADRVRQARKPLTDFAGDPLLACQTDNLMLRMLLWPHPLVPAAQFIDTVHDGQLVRQAMARLLEFDFVGVVEDDAFLHRLQCWLGRPFAHNRVNETRAIPQQFRTPLHRELTPEAYDLLDARSRLDFRLWAAIAARRLPERDIFRLRAQTILANVARHSVLMGC